MSENAEAPEEFQEEDEVSQEPETTEEPEYRQEKEVAVEGKLQLTDEQFVEVFNPDVPGDVQPGGGDPELKGYDPEVPDAPDYVYEGHDGFPDSEHEGDVQPGTPSEEKMREDDAESQEDEAPPVDGWDEAVPAVKKAPPKTYEKPDTFTGPNKLRENYLRNEGKK